MARKLKKIRLSQVRYHAQLQCTLREIAAGCGVSYKTFKDAMDREPLIGQVIEEGRSQGHISLRRKQNRLASTSAQMAIHLGKQYLGHKDTTIHEHTGKDGKPIEHVDLGKLSAEERQQLRQLLTRTTRSE